MERVGHLRMMSFTSPIMCTAQWFLMGPRISCSRRTS
jgi:hypothetical protein